MNYSDFLQTKIIKQTDCGFETDAEFPSTFGFQDRVIRFALRRGRAAVFAGCGMGSEGYVGRNANATTPAPYSRPTARRSNRCTSEN